MADTTMSPSDKRKRITSRLSYSFGAFGHDMFYATLSTYFIMFVTSHLFDKSSGGQNARMIGYITTIIMILRFVELVIDPFIGNTIDNTDTRWGHFKPWVVAGGTVGSVMLIILFTNMGGLNVSNPILYLILFAVFYITMDIFYSFKDVGFWSMIPAISFDSAEREKTATFARVGSNIGANIVGIIVMPLVLFFSINSNNGQGDNRGWFFFAVIIGLTSWISAIAVGLGTKEKHSELRENKEKTTFKGVFKVLLSNDQLMWMALTYCLYTTGIAILNSLELYYFTYILGKPAEFSFLASLNAIIGIFSVLTFPSLAQKFSRRRVFFLSIIVMLFGVLLFFFAGSSLPIVLTAAVLFYVPQTLIFLVVLMILSDSVEYGQLKNGHRDESLTLSVRPLLDKFGGAVSNGVVGLTAVWAGMTSGASASDITTHGQMVFKLMMFGVPAILILLGTFTFWKKVTLDEKEHAEIVDELEKTWHKHLNSDAESMSDIREDVNEQTLSYVAPVDGEVVPLNSVGETNFASGKMGKGFAIKPSDGHVYAPFDGVIEATFPTRHAVGLKAANGTLSLIHIGVDTVKMRGTGFVSQIKKGQAVKKGDLLIEFSPLILKKAGYDDTVMAVITNGDKISNFNYLQQSGNVKHGNEVLNLAAPTE